MNGHSYVNTYVTRKEISNTKRQDPNGVSVGGDEAHIVIRYSPFCILHLLIIDP